MPFITGYYDYVQVGFHMTVYVGMWHMYKSLCEKCVNSILILELKRCNQTKTKVIKQGNI